MEIKIGYKVLSKNLRSVCDTFYGRDWDKLSVQYSINEWVKPKIENTQLFLFKMLRDAERFRHDISHGQVRLHIYESEYIPDDNPIIIYEPSSYNSNSIFYKLLKSPNINPLYKPLIIKTPPTGTVAAKQIRLIERI